MCRANRQEKVVPVLAVLIRRFVLPAKSAGLIQVPYHSVKHHNYTKMCHTVMYLAILCHTKLYHDVPLYVSMYVCTIPEYTILNCLLTVCLFSMHGPVWNVCRCATKVLDVVFLHDCLLSNFLKSWVDKNHKICKLSSQVHGSLYGITPF